MIVLRIGKRRASYTATNPQEFCELECWDRSADVADRHLSVYEIEDLDPMIIRTHAEHAAGVGLDPPRGGCHWNNLVMGWAAHQQAVAAAGGWTPDMLREHSKALHPEEVRRT